MARADRRRRSRFPAYRAATRPSSSAYLRPSCSVTAKKVLTRAVADKVGGVSSVGTIVGVGGGGTGVIGGSGGESRGGGFFQRVQLTGDVLTERGRQQRCR